MTRSGPPSALPEQDYDAIEAAVMETARGRWFLAEFARRNRNADTEMLLKAIAKLQDAMSDHADDGGIGRFRKDLLEMADAIAQTKREIASMRPNDGSEGRIGEATLELDAIVESTEQATSEILQAAEQVQELAWTMRENGAPASSCDAIDTHVTEIYTACSFQDLTGQRTQKVVKVLRFIEKRIESMVKIWDGNLPAGSDDMEDARPDAHLLNGPQLAGKGASQDEVNSLLQREVDLDDLEFADIDDGSAAIQADRIEQEPVEGAETIGFATASDHLPADSDETSQGEHVERLAAVESASPYDPAELEQAAQHAVAVPETSRFVAYPDAVAQVPSGHTPGASASPFMAGDDTRNEHTSDQPVVVPSLHELAFKTAGTEGTPDEDKAAKEAFASLASDLEHQVGAKADAPPLEAAGGDPFDRLTANQRIALFS